MTSEQEAVLLRIFVKENDRYEGKPLYMAIVEAAHGEGLAGATVLRGVVGYGSSHEIHTARLLELSSELPMVIEIVDWEGRVDAFIERIGEIMERGLITTERVNVAWYRSKTE